MLEAPLLTTPGIGESMPATGATALDRCSSPQTPRTPRRLRVDTTRPPPAPCARRVQSELSDEIDEAIKDGSAALLEVALMRCHRCNSGQHAVNEAVQQRHVPALELLLKSSTPVDKVCCGQRPLHLALQSCFQQGDIGHKMAHCLLQAGALPTASDFDGYNQPPPLHEAVKRGCLAAVSLLLSTKAHPDELDRAGKTPLQLLCQQMAFERSYNQKLVPVITLLLSHGADPTSSLAFVVDQPRLYEKLQTAEYMRKRRIVSSVHKSGAIPHAFFTYSDILTRIMDFL